ncbi:hypothetical protein N7535_006890 [Penicillium sp. DV-2018c]|nr:hypothetical protein N7461_007026 [Penicillium sp. DV-2018c]KAJ5567584.1 hypothetical protein N7535_006890 [Penicillium sp. DV-2018c]
MTKQRDHQRSVSVVSPWDVSSALLLFGLGAPSDLLGPSLRVTDASLPARKTCNACDVCDACDTARDTARDAARDAA